MSEEIDQIKTKICEFIIDRGGFDPKNDFVNIDTTWINPDDNEKISDLVVQYIRQAYNVDEISSILTVDTLAFPFGPVPIATLICYRLKKPLGVIKEGNDPISGRHRLYGIRPKENIFVFCDVTRFGISAMKLLFHLFDEGIYPKWFLTIVDFDKGAFEFLTKAIKERGSSEIEFKSILTLQDLQKSIKLKGGSKNDAR